MHWQRQRKSFFVGVIFFPLVYGGAMRFDFHKITFKINVSNEITLSGELYNMSFKLFLKLFTNTIASFNK